MVFHNPLKDKKVLITCGPAWVPIDSVRYISNISTGRLGHLIAREMLQAQAKVTMLEGPVANPFSDDRVHVVKYQYFDELTKKWDRALRDTHRVIIHAAAVPDFTTNGPYPKLNSDLAGVRLALNRTPKLIDLAQELNPKAFLVGFKLEPEADKDTLIEKAVKLLERARCKLVVANIARKKSYKAYIVAPKGEVLAEAGSREELASQLIKTLQERL